MNPAGKGRVVLRGLVPLAVMVFFVADAFRNPQRMYLSLFFALLAGLVVFARWRPRK